MIVLLLHPECGSRYFNFYRAGGKKKLSHKTERTIKGIFIRTEIGTEWVKDKDHQENLRSTTSYCCKKENYRTHWVKAKTIHTQTTDVEWAEKTINEGTLLLCYRTTGATHWQQVLSNLTRQSRLSGIEWHFAGRRKGSAQTVKIRKKLICLVYEKIIASVSNSTCERKFFWLFACW